MGSAYIKNDTGQPQLSQISYEDHLIADNSILGSIPVSQSDAPLSLESSQYSSGYYSDSSCSGSVNLKGSRLRPPKVTCKHLSDSKEYQKTQSSFTTTSLVKIPFLSSSHIQTTSLTTGDCSHLTNSLENGFIQRDTTASTTTYKSKRYHIPSQPSSAKMSMIPKPSSGKSTAGYCTCSDCYSPAAATGTHSSDPKLVLGCLLIFDT